MIEKYHAILCPEKTDFLKPYLACPSLQRLKGVGLFCGIDYCSLYHSHQFYSRYDHSVGVALIVYHFTHDINMTLSGLLHDLSTPAFSHVIDFKNKDYLHQVSTEKKNSSMIYADTMLMELLKKNHIDIDKICHHERYPIVDAPIPCLCADRLEYMYATGLFLTDSFTLDSIQTTYQDLSLQNHIPLEMGFSSYLCAKRFFDGCYQVSSLFQEEGNKLILQLLSDLIDDLLENHGLHESQLFSMSENEILQKMASIKEPNFQKKYIAFRQQTKVYTAHQYVENCACCISLNVKKRYVDPLLNHQRLSKDHIDVYHDIVQLLSLSSSTYSYLPFI